MSSMTKTEQQTQALVLTLKNSPFEFDVPDLGHVYMQVSPDLTGITLASRNGLLWDNTLWSLHAQFGKHGEVWYPVSGSILTGLGAVKPAPSKVASPMLMQIAAALNAHLVQNYSVFHQHQIDIQRKRLERCQSSIEDAQQRLDRAEEELRREDSWKRTAVENAKRALIAARDNWSEEDGKLAEMLAMMQEPD